ncbi:Aldo/keto reductase [Leucogyrophana mollusca]|uniref:Aldo/keto reductase n=1 Tax=Leucogyrophana mollusca TaxID=85980 RepID=A0ACB8B1B8_9AGAM|nr:Aldo/keto reductase [Leucogyrophana mollusca]
MRFGVLRSGDNPAPLGPDGTLRLDETCNFNETWAEMENVLASGKVKAIGVSNFSTKTLEQLLKTAKIVPAVLQVELHPFLAQHDLLRYCREKGIVVAAYAATGYAPVRDDPTISALAKKYQVTPTQIILSWHVGRDTAAIVKSANIDRQKENLKIVALDREDARSIDALDRNQRLCIKPDRSGMVFGWSYDRLGWREGPPVRKLDVKL